MSKANSIMEQLEQHLAHMSANDPDNCYDVRSAIIGAAFALRKAQEECGMDSTYRSVITVGELRKMELDLR